LPLTLAASATRGRLDCCVNAAPFGDIQPQKVAPCRQAIDTQSRIEAPDPRAAGWSRPTFQSKTGSTGNAPPGFPATRHVDDSQVRTCSPFVHMDIFWGNRGGQSPSSLAGIACGFDWPDVSLGPDQYDWSRSPGPPSVVGASLFEETGECFSVRGGVSEAAEPTSTSEYRDARSQDLGCLTQEASCISPVLSEWTSGWPRLAQEAQEGGRELAPRRQLCSTPAQNAGGFGGILVCQGATRLFYRREPASSPTTRTEGQVPRAWGSHAPPPSLPGRHGACCCC
jgi:hypothetical protein